MNDEFDLTIVAYAIVLTVMSFPKKKKNLSK